MLYVYCFLEVFLIDFFCKFGINLSVKVNWKDKEFIQGGSLNECNFDFSIIYWHKKQFWCFNASYKCSLCLILSVPLNNLPPISIFQLLSCRGLTDDFQTSRRFSKIIAIFHFSFDLSSLSQRPFLSTRFLVSMCVHNKLIFFSLWFRQRILTSIFLLISLLVIISFLVRPQELLQ